LVTALQAVGKLEAGTLIVPQADYERVMKQLAPPPILRQAVTATAALAGAAGTAFKGQPVRASQVVIEMRQAICRTCEHLRPDNRCSLCGCWMLLKASLAAQSCPDKPPRWNSFSIPASPAAEGPGTKVSPAA